MLGDRFATVSGSDSSAYRFIEEIMRSEQQKEGKSGEEQGQQQEEGEDDEVREKKSTLKILLLIKDFDDKLMLEAVKQISSLVFSFMM